MIRNRHLAKWLMITLIMAIGIGTFGALYINSEKKKETSDAQPSSYLTNQRQHDIDMTELKSFLGDYQAVESGSPDEENYVPGWWICMRGCRQTGVQREMASMRYLISQPKTMA